MFLQYEFTFPPFALTANDSSPVHIQEGVLVQVAPRQCAAYSKFCAAGLLPTWLLPQPFPQPGPEG